MVIMLVSIGIAAILWGIIIYVLTHWGDNFSGYGGMDEGEDDDDGGRGKKPKTPKLPEGGPDKPKDDTEELNEMLDAIGKVIEQEEKSKELVPYSYCEWKECNGKKKMDNQ